ncbi:MAG: zinc-binding alcohol dehydrogenase family protein [Cyanobacteriota bacterium]
MRAVGYQHSLPIDDDQALCDIELPMPLYGDGDLLVRVQAVGVNPVDTKVRRRETPAPGQWRVLGWDCAGVVEAVGADVRGFQPGDRIWYAGALNRPGCQSEWHAVDARLVGRRPRSLTAPEAAALPLSAITAWELLEDRLRLPLQAGGIAGSGSTLLVIGGAGGVGSMLVQLAQRCSGLKVVATASTGEGMTWLEALGADAVINHHQPLRPQLEAIGISGIELVASLTHTHVHFEALVDLLRPQGALALIDDPDPTAINLLSLKRKSLSLHWELMFTRSLFQTEDMGRQGEILTTVADLVDRGSLRSTARTFLGAISAAGLRRAHAELEAHHSIGKLVLDGFS